VSLDLIDLSLAGSAFQTAGPARKRSFSELGSSAWFDEGVTVGAV